MHPNQITRIQSKIDQAILNRDRHDPESPRYRAWDGEVSKWTAALNRPVKASYAPRPEKREPVRWHRRWGVPYPRSA